MSLRARTCEIAHPHASSGSQGPSEISRGSSNRIRGWAQEVLIERSSAIHLVTKIWAAQSEHPDCDRTKVRAVVSNTFLNEGLRTSIDGLRVEGIIPLSVIGDMDHSIVYLGKNSAGRIPDQAVHLDLVRANSAATTRERPNPNNILAQVADLGYSLERLSVPTESDVYAITDLYREAFTRYMVELTPDIVREMLNEPGNIPVVARNGSGQIISALIAERADLPVEGFRHVPTYELSDFATFQAHQGHGLMTALQIQAVRMIEAEHGVGRAVIFAEDRGCWPAVVASSHKAGLTPVGVLPADVVIGSTNTQFDEGVSRGLETLIPVLYGLHPADRVSLETFIHQ